MSLTTEYAALHNAFAHAAETYNQRPLVARIAFALYERGGTATSHDLEDDCGMHGSAIRRALIEMYATDLAFGWGADGGRRRRGVVSKVTLTKGGRKMAALVERSFQTFQADELLAVAA